MLRRPQNATPATFTAEQQAAHLAKMEADNKEMCARNKEIMLRLQAEAKAKQAK